MPLVGENYIDFVSVEASAIKSWGKSRIFRYGLPEDFFSKGHMEWRTVRGLRVIQNKNLKTFMVHFSVQTYTAKRKKVIPMSE